MVQGWQKTIYWKEIYCYGTRKKLLFENYSNQKRGRRNEFGFPDFLKISVCDDFLGIAKNSLKGIYECCAINRAGIGRAVIHLTVKEMEYFRSVVNDRIVSVDELKDAYLSG